MQRPIVRDPSDPGAHWLADAHPDPDQVWMDWDQHCIALLPAGRIWDALALSEPRMHAVARHLAPDVREICPVLLDQTTRRYYLLVPPGAITEDEPLGAGATLITTGSWLVVPRPLGVQVMTATWLTPPGACAKFAPPEVIKSLRHTATDAGKGTSR